MGRQFPGSFLPYGQEQIVDSARPHFRLVASSNGRLDYIETIRQWRKRFAAPSPRKTLLKLQLLPRWLTVLTLVGVPLALADAGSYDGGPLESVGLAGLAFFLLWSLVTGVLLSTSGRIQDRSAARGPRGTMSFS